MPVANIDFWVFLVLSAIHGLLALIGLINLPFSVLSTINRILDKKENSEPAAQWTSNKLLKGLQLISWVMILISLFSSSIIAIKLLNYDYTQRKHEVGWEGIGKDIEQFDQAMLITEPFPIIALILSLISLLVIRRSTSILPPITLLAALLASVFWFYVLYDLFILEGGYAMD